MPASQNRQTVQKGRLLAPRRNGLGVEFSDHCWVPTCTDFKMRIARMLDTRTHKTKAESFYRPPETPSGRQSRLALRSILAATGIGR